MFLLFPFSLKPLLWQVSCTCKEGMLHGASKRSLTKSQPGWLPLQSVMTLLTSFVQAHFYEVVHSSLSLYMRAFFLSIWCLLPNTPTAQIHRKVKSSCCTFFLLPVICHSRVILPLMTEKERLTPFFCCTDLNNLKLTSYFGVSSTRVESGDPCWNPCPFSVFFAVRS